MKVIVVMVVKGQVDFLRLVEGEHQALLENQIDLRVHAQALLTPLSPPC